MNVNILITVLQALNLSENFDIPLQIVGGITATILGYYISSKMLKNKTDDDRNFKICFAFCFSGALMIIRKLVQFFIDFYTGSNLMKCDFVADDHWLFRVFGFGMSKWEQRPLMDMGEDFALGVIGSVISVIGIFIYTMSAKKSKSQSVREKTVLLCKNLPERCINKIEQEKSKLQENTNIFDLLLWWCVRGVMIYAFLTMENRAEATLLGVNLLGTFAISLLHLISPRDSFLCKISYKVQSLVVVMVFIGSYCGNYVLVYNILPRFDLFMHFISGALAVTAGYYIARVFIKGVSRRERILVILFALSFSLMIITVHEMIEFIGDFIWGTSNQGFYWGPADDSFFFVLFGHGAGNTQLYYLFDTMYDALLALSSTVGTLPVLYGLQKYSRKKPLLKNDAENQMITC